MNKENAFDNTPLASEPEEVVVPEEVIEGSMVMPPETHGIPSSLKEKLYAERAGLLDVKEIAEKNVETGTEMIQDLSTTINANNTFIAEARASIKSLTESNKKLRAKKATSQEQLRTDKQILKDCEKEIKVLDRAIKDLD